MSGAGLHFEDYLGLPRTRSTGDRPSRQVLLNALALLATDLRTSPGEWTEPELLQARQMVAELSELLDRPRRLGRAPRGGES